MMRNDTIETSTAVSPMETVTSEKIFGFLGPPPKQPRTLKFVPQCGKVGRGTRHMRREAAQEIRRISNWSMIWTQIWSNI